MFFGHNKKRQKLERDISLYLFESDTFPSEFIEEKFVLVGESTSHLAKEELMFVSTLLINSASPDNIVSEFDSWWRENVRGNIKLEILTSGVSSLAKYLHKKASKLGEDEWSLNSNFFAYNNRSNSDRLDAVRLIKESDLNLM